MGARDRGRQSPPGSPGAQAAPGGGEPPRGRFRLRPGGNRGVMVPNPEPAVLLLIPPVPERELGRGGPRSPFAVVREGMLGLSLPELLLLGRCHFPLFRAQRRPAFKHLRRYSSETFSPRGQT